MKKLLSIISIFALSLMLVGCSKRITLENKTYETEEDIEVIQVNDLNMNITIKKSNTDKITVEYGTAKEYTLYVTYEHSNKSLTLRREQAKSMFFNSYDFDKNSETVITVPEDKEIKYTVAIENGGITLSNIKPLESSFRTDSGSISLNNVISSEKVELKTINGEVSLKDSEFKELKVNVNNGSIRLDTVEVKEDLFTKTDNGETRYEDVTASKIESESGHGEQNLRNVDFIVIMSVKTTTGAINLLLKGKRSDYLATASAGTGKVTGTTEEGQKNVTCRTTVGDVNIRYAG